VVTRNTLRDIVQTQPEWQAEIPAGY